MRVRNITGGEPVTVPATDRSGRKRIGIASVLFVPLGAGPECLGFLVLTRPA